VIPLLVFACIGLILLFGAAVLFFKAGWRALYAALPAVALGSVPFIIKRFGYGGEFLTIVFAPVFVGAAAGITFGTGRSLQFYLLVTTVTLTVLFTANYCGLKHFRNIDLVRESEKQVREIINSSSIAQPEKDAAMSRVDASLATIRDVVPFTYFMNALLGALLCYYILRRLLTRQLNAGGREPDGIELLRFNDYFIFVLIFGWLAVLLADRGRYYVVYVTGLNAALSLSALYLLQALGIVKFYVVKKGLPPFILPLGLAVMVFLGIEVALFVAVILLSVGALDFWADFRRLEKSIKK
jgi:hypothetical protein